MIPRRSFLRTLVALPLASLMPAPTVIDVVVQAPQVPAWTLFDPVLVDMVVRRMPDVTLTGFYTE